MSALGRAGPGATMLIDDTAIQRGAPLRHESDLEADLMSSIRTHTDGDLQNLDTLRMSPLGRSGRALCTRHRDPPDVDVVTGDQQQGSHPQGHKARPKTNCTGLPLFVLG